MICDFDMFKCFRVLSIFTFFLLCIVFVRHKIQRDKGLDYLWETDVSLATPWVIWRRGLIPNVRETACTLLSPRKCKSKNCKDNVLETSQFISRRWKRLLQDQKSSEDQMYFFVFCQNKLCPNIGKIQYSNFIHPPSPLETTRISCHGQTDKTPIFLLLPLERFFLQIFLLYYNQHISLFAFCVPSWFSSCVPPLPLRKNIEFNAKKCPGGSAI